MDLSSLDIKDVCNLNGFSGTIPLFPLSTVVFFPNTLLPLHVFEPRYKQMVHDVSKSEGIIGMALLKPGWEANYYGNPEVFDVVGMGRIVSSEVFGDGRINIVLYGLKRVKIIEVMKESPYRVARVELVENTRCCERGDVQEQNRGAYNEMEFRARRETEGPPDQHQYQAPSGQPDGRPGDSHFLKRLRQAVAARGARREEESGDNH